jgi:hypothetical protein
MTESFAPPCSCLQRWSLARFDCDPSIGIGHRLQAQAWQLRKQQSRRHYRQCAAFPLEPHPKSHPKPTDIGAVDFGRIDCGNIRSASLRCDSDKSLWDDSADTRPEDLHIAIDLVNAPFDDLRIDSQGRRPSSQLAASRKCIDGAPGKVHS